MSDHSKKVRQPQKRRRSASWDLVGLATNTDGTVTIHPKAKNVEALLARVGEEDPAALLVWNHSNIQLAVNAINAAAPGVVPPAWLGGAYPIGADQLMQSIVAKVCAEAGAGGVIGNCLLGPNTIMQYANIKTCLIALGQDDIIRLAPAVPLARNFILCDA
jgi:hypothetical protein